MSHKQITKCERNLIHYHLRAGRRPAQIAKMLHRHRSTIGREIRRNVHGNGSYIARIAQAHANGRRSRTRKKVQYSAHDWSVVCNLIRQDCSPEQASGYLKRLGVLSMSHQTIYKYIWRERCVGGRLWKHLRQSGKKRRKKYGGADSRGVLLGKRDIEERPKGARERTKKGHYEVDLVHGAGCRESILTLVDRKSRLVFIRKVADKSMGEANRVLVPLLRKIKALTVTADNGTEFHGYQHVEKLTGVKFYFAKPYHSWERGTSENTNGLIRQYLPKNKSMAGVTQWECNAIAKKLNRRPRKLFHFKTPEETHYDIPSLLHF